MQLQTYMHQYNELVFMMYKKLIQEINTEYMKLIQEINTEYMKLI